MMWHHITEPKNGCMIHVYTLNNSLIHVFHSNRTCHIEQFCASELFSSDSHDLPIISIQKKKDINP